MPSLFAVKFPEPQFKHFLLIAMRSPVHFHTVRNPESQDRVVYEGFEFHFGSLFEVLASSELQIYCSALPEDAFEFFVDHLLSSVMSSFTQLPDRPKLSSTRS